MALSFALWSLWKAHLWEVQLLGNCWEPVRSSIAANPAPDEPISSQKQDHTALSLAASAGWDVGFSSKDPHEIMWSCTLFTVILHSSSHCQHSPPGLWEILHSDWNNKRVYFSLEHLNYDHFLSFALGVLGVQTHVGQARAVTLNYVPSLDSEHSHIIYWGSRFQYFFSFWLWLP